MNRAAATTPADNDWLSEVGEEDPGSALDEPPPPEPLPAPPPREPLPQGGDASLP